MLNQTSCIFTKIEEHRNTKLCSWKNEHFLCGSSFPDKVTGSKRRKKKKSNQKLNHILIKARQKEKERERVAQLAKAQMRERNKQKCFSSMSRTHSAFSRKGSKPKSAG